MEGKKWMIYGAYGYSGTLIAELAGQNGLRPVLAGRNRARVKQLAERLGFDLLAFGLDDPDVLRRNVADFDLVLNCAGPFSATAEPMIEACLSSGTHYLDITGEIAVFELAQARAAAARAAGVVLCPGVGFDVIPTDCLASALKSALPSATHLALGFDSRSGFSPGTAKTSVEGLAQGGKIRRDGRIVPVPLAWHTRRIDFGDGEKLAMTIPWGDVSTAFFSTGIGNVEVYIPASPRLVRRLKYTNYLRPLLRLGPVQTFLKSRVDKRIEGPSESQRARLNTWVWGEVRDASGAMRTGRVTTANGYTVTMHGALAIVRHVLTQPHQSGTRTPSQIMGADFVTTLPGSGRIEISA